MVNFRAVNKYFKQRGLRSRQTRNTVNNVTAFSCFFFFFGLFCFVFLSHSNLSWRSVVILQGKNRADNKKKNSRGTAKLSAEQGRFARHQGYVVWKTKEATNSLSWKIERFLYLAKGTNMMLAYLSLFVKPFKLRLLRFFPWLYIFFQENAA